MSAAKRHISAQNLALLGRALHLRILDSGLLDLAFYQWLLARAREGVRVELILSESAGPDSMDISRVYFHHLVNAGGQVYACQESAAAGAFLLTDDLVLLPENAWNATTRPGFGVETQQAVVARFSALFQQYKTLGSIRSDLFGLPDSETSGVSPVYFSTQANIDIRFWAQPALVQVNERFELHWEVKGAERVTIEPLLGEVPARGSRVLSAEQTTLFRLKAANRHTELFASAQVVIDPVPSIEYVLSVPDEHGREEHVLYPENGRLHHFGVIKGTPLRLHWRCFYTEQFTIDGQPAPQTGNRMLLASSPHAYLLRASGGRHAAETTILVDVFQRPEIESLVLPETAPIHTAMQWEMPAPTPLGRPVAQPIWTPHEASTPPANASAGQRIRHFLWFCAGANQSLLAAAPASEGARYAGIGGAVFFTGLLAALSGGYALFTVFGSVLAAFLFGLIWGTLIFNLDRLIVASMKKDGEGNTWLQAIPRFLLAIILSVVIAKPLELRIFQPEINAILANSKRIQTERIEAGFDLKVKKVNQHINAAKAETAAFLQRRETLYQEYRCECDGTCGTGKTGRGSECARKELKYQQAQQEYEAAKTENDRLIAADRLELQTLEDTKAKEIQAWLDTRSDGLVARLNASSELPFLPGFSIILLILMVEIAPVLSKLLTPAGAYEQASRLVEDRFIRQHENNIEEEQRMTEQASALRVKLHGMETDEATAQKSAMMRLMAEAQLQLVKDKVAEWLETERKKGK